MTNEQLARLIAAVLIAGRSNEDQQSPAVWREYVTLGRKVVSAAIPGGLT